MKTNKHKKAGKMGGLATKNAHPNQFKEMANKQWERRKVLEGLTVGDLSNPVVLKSIQDKLEEIDKN